MTLWLDFIETCLKKLRVLSISLIGDGLVDLVRNFLDLEQINWQNYEDRYSQFDLLDTTYSRIRILWHIVGWPEETKLEEPFAEDNQGGFVQFISLIYSCGYSVSQDLNGVQISVSFVLNFYNKSIQAAPSLIRKKIKDKR